MRKIGYMDVPMIANDPVLRKLAQISDYSTMSLEDQKKYERSIKVMRDNYATYLGAIQEGMEKGKLQERLANARAMKSEGLSDDLIMKITGLSASEVQKLS